MPTAKQRRNSENLRPWQKGQSGNPAGRRSKANCLTTLLKDEIERIDPDDKEGRTWQEQIVLATIRLAIQGNATALKEIWERMDGKVTQSLAAPADVPSNIVVRFVSAGDSTHEKT